MSNDNYQKSINLSSKSYIIYAGLISEEKVYAH